MFKLHMLGTDKREKCIFPIQKVHFSDSNLPRYFQNSEKMFKYLWN